MLNTLMTHWVLRVLFPLTLCLGGAAIFQSPTSADVVPQVSTQGYWRNVFTFDSQQEYEACVTTNNDEHDYGGSYPVERVAGPEPNRPGALRMQNLRDVGPASATRGYVIPACAVVTFDVPTGDSSPVGLGTLCATISVTFDYLFRSQGGVVTVVVRQGTLEISLPSLIAPGPESPGSSTGTAWGRYSERWDQEDIQFDSGRRQITLKLRGPASTQVMIDDLTVEASYYYLSSPRRRSDPLHSGEAAAISIRCISHCGDIAGVDRYSVGPEDYLAAVYNCRLRALDESELCLDGEFTADEAMSIEDAEYFDWAEAYPPIRSCDNGPAAASAGIAAAVAPLHALGSAPEAPLLVAGKTYAYDPYNDECQFLADRIFGFHTDGKPAGGPMTWGEDRLNTRLAKDHSGVLYQLNAREGIVRLSDGRSVLPRCCLPCEGNDVYVGWNRDKGAPPMQDLAFDESGDVYVVPVLVAPPGGESYRAAARIHLGPTPDENRVGRLYGKPLFAGGVHEIELGPHEKVFILDKRHWTDSILLCYDRDSGSREDNLEWLDLLQGVRPSAFHVSRRDGRIFLVSENDSLVQASSLNADSTDIQRTEIRGMSYITDITEESDTGTIWLAGFYIESWPNAADVRNGATLFLEPGFKPVLAGIPRDSHGPIEATVVSDYAIAGKEYLSLPLSIVYIGGGP